MIWVDLAVPLVSYFEGCPRRKSDGLAYPYLDKLAKPPVWTRGFGRCFEISGSSPAITIDEAKAELAEGLKVYGDKCAALAPGLVSRPPCLAAVASWSWNCGVGAFKASRLRRAINEERWEDAAELIRKPNTAGGVVLKGLDLRRMAEQKLFRTGI